jgi:hypothetical protein
VLTLVVGRDGDVHIGDGRVGIAKGNRGDVHVSSLLDGLVVSARVGHNQQAGLLEVLLDLIGERSWGVSTSQGLSTKILGELIDCTLTIGASRDKADILGEGESELRGKSDIRASGIDKRSSNKARTTIRSSKTDLGILDGDDNACSELELLVGLL